MNDTNRRISTTNQRRRTFATLAVPATLSMTIAEGFCPLPTITKLPTRVSDTPRLYQRRPSCLGLSSTEDNEENNTLHQQIKKADSEWYKEYVSDLLGDEYCTERWPEMKVLPLLGTTRAETKIDLEESAADTTTSSTTTPPEDESDDELDDEPNEEITEMDSPEMKDDTKGAKSVDVENEDSDEDEVDAESDDPTETIFPVADEASTAPLENETKDEKEEKDTAGDTNEKSTDERAIVYRSITGKKMTCVSLSSLLELGYTVGDLERIQAEFLSIVVLDKRQCPSMGVPSQWKISDPKAKPEVVLVESMEVATNLVNEQNVLEREEKESIQKRRERQEGRRDSAPKTTSRRERSSKPAEIQDRGKLESRRSRGEPRKTRDNERPRRRQNESPPPPRDRRRRQQQRRESLDREGNPRKIYRVPRDDTKRVQREDPPDPESPLWVNMDTFRDLLQKEADFRMNFIGSDWEEVIAQENDWREDLYKGWLWSLNNGVGESIVPPSRYERARRQQQQQQQRAKSMANRSKPKRRRPPSEAPRERRSGRPQQQLQQPLPPKRRPNRKTKPSSEEPRSEAERRSRRRAERRRGPSDDE